MMGPTRSAAVALLLLGGAARAGDATVMPYAARLVDRPLIAADGSRHRFLTDLAARTPVLLSFTFTGCRSLCPAGDLVMEAVAARLRARGDGKVRLLTLTLDPLTDTPDRLQRERAREMDPARLFLTGDPEDVWAVLRGLGIEGGPNPDHEGLVLLIGDGGRTIHTLPGLSDPDELAAAAAALR